MRLSLHVAASFALGLVLLFVTKRYVPSPSRISIYRNWSGNGSTLLLNTVVVIGSPRKEHAA